MTMRLAGQSDQAARGALFEIRQGLGKDLAERHETALDRFLSEAQDGLLGAAQGLLGDQASVQAVAGDVAAGLNQPASHRAFFDDLDVAFEAAEIGKGQVEAGEIGHATDDVELVLLLERRLQRAQIDLRVGLLDLEHRAVDGAVALRVEILGRQSRREHGKTTGVEENPGQHCALGLLAVRKRADLGLRF